MSRRRKVTLAVALAALVTEFFVAAGAGGAWFVIPLTVFVVALVQLNVMNDRDRR